MNNAVAWINRCLLAVLALAALAFSISICSRLSYYLTVDEVVWGGRYYGFVQAPFDIPETQPLNPDAGRPSVAGMSNRVLVGLPGCWLFETFDIDLFSACRAVQLGVTLLVTLLTFYLLARPVMRGKRYLLPFACAIFLAAPPIASMARVLNYDIVSLLFMLLSIVLYIVAYRFMAADQPRPKMIKCLLLILASGVCAGLSFAGKQYGIFAIAYVGALLSFLPFKARTVVAHMLSSALCGCVFVFGIVVAVILITPSVWVHPEVLGLYLESFKNINLRPAYLIAGFIALPLAQLAVSAVGCLATRRLETAVFPETHARAIVLTVLAAFTLLLVYAWCCQWRGLWIVFPSTAGSFKHVWQTAHVTYSFNQDTVLGERLFHLSSVIRGILWVLPEYVLIMLPAALLLRLRRKDGESLDAAEIILLGFSLFFIIVAHAVMLYPYPRYLLPAVYAIVALAAYVFVKHFDIRRASSAVMVLAAIACIGTYVACLHPHYLGFMNALRSRKAEAFTSFSRLESLYYGWGENNDTALFWLDQQGLIRDGVKVIFDYPPIPRQTFGKNESFSVNNRYGLQPLDADYFVLTKQNAFRNPAIAETIRTKKPLHAIGYLGAYNTFIYSREDILQPGQ